MQKVQALVHQSDVASFLDCVQRFGAMEFAPDTDSDLAPVTTTAPHAEAATRITNAVAGLAAFEQTPSLWQRLRNGTDTTLSEAELRARIDTLPDTLTTVATIEETQTKLATAEATSIHLDTERDFFNKWQGV